MNAYTTAGRLEPGDRMPNLAFGQGALVTAVEHDGNRVHVTFEPCHSRWMPGQTLTHLTFAADDRVIVRIPCDHATSLYGRCADCGMTWAEQAARMAEVS